jgi:hypothetical protein
MIRGMRKEERKAMTEKRNDNPLYSHIDPHMG